MKPQGGTPNGWAPTPMGGLALRACLGSLRERLVPPEWCPLEARRLAERPR